MSQIVDVNPDATTSHGWRVTSRGGIPRGDKGEPRAFVTSCPVAGLSTYGTANLLPASGVAFHHFFADLLTAARSGITLGASCVTRRFNLLSIFSRNFDDRSVLLKDP